MASIAMGRSHFCDLSTLVGSGFFWIYEGRRCLLELAAGDFGRGYLCWRPLPLGQLAPRALRVRVPLWNLHGQYLLGSLVLGIVFGVAQQGSLSSGTILFLTVGVLGGFTTFSSFSFETMQLLILVNVVASLLNIAGQFVLSLLAVYLGFTLLRDLG
jgi:protein CrcB